jgi:vesicle-fusing ATPase
MKFSPNIDRILAAGRQDVQAVQHSESIRTLATVMHGPPGSGKTALAARLAMDSEFPFIKLITAQNMVGYTEMAKIQALDKIFTDADKSRSSVLVIDDIELLLDWNPIGPRFSNTVLSALKSLLKRKPPKERRRLVLATTSERTVLAQLQLLQFFSSEIAVPNVNTQQELAWILHETRAFASDAEIRNVIAQLEDVTRTKNVGVGIKQVLTAINKAKEATGDVSGSFVDWMGQAIAVRGD